MICIHRIEQDDCEICQADPHVPYDWAASCDADWRDSRGLWRCTKLIDHKGRHRMRKVVAS